MATLARHVALGLAVCVSLVAGAGSALASGSAAGRGHAASRRDTFRASIVAATGSYAGDTGQAVLYLRPRGTGPSRPVRVVFRGLSCGSSAHCLDLTGRLTGSLTKSGNQVPDIGMRYRLAATGRLSSLATVTAEGGVQGTGFIIRAHERLRIVLTNSSGSVTLRARSPLVKGFTSP